MPLLLPPLAALLSPDAASALIGHAFALVQGAYQRAPTLVLALTALLILPTVALISVATQAVRRYRRRPSAMRGADPVPGEMPDAAGLPARSQAWLTVEGADTVPLAGQVARIGRHPDSDIRLWDRSVYRRHAVVERTPDEAFVIVDVSGKGGVRVNGQRTERVQLSDGDVIELGRARLKFETIRPEELPMESRHPVEIGG